MEEFNDNKNSNKVNDFSSPEKKSSSTSRLNQDRMMSAEEKLKKSLNNLSHTGSSGGINAELKTSKTSSYSGEKRRKVGGVVLDIEAIQEASNQKIDTRGKRNNAIITILVILLIISLVYLTITVVNYINSKRSPNCRYSIQGDVQAEWIVEGSKETEFLVQDGIAPGTIYWINSNIDIQTEENVTLTITIKVSCDGEEINVGLTGLGENIILAENGTYIYDGVISGGGTVHLFEGIDFNAELPENINSRNIKIEIVAYLTLA